MLLHDISSLLYDLYYITKTAVSNKGAVDPAFKPMMLLCFMDHSCQSFGTRAASQARQERAQGKIYGGEPPAKGGAG
jgi:hypothetical protein